MLTPENAWTPLPASEWNHQTARHLAARLGFSLNPSLVKQIERIGPGGTLNAFLGKIEPFKTPGSIMGMQDTMMEMQTRMTKSSPVEKRELRQEIQKGNRQSFQQYAVDWYTFAKNPKFDKRAKLQ